MAQTLIVCLMLGLIIGTIVGYPALQQWQRDRLKSRPFPTLWQATLEQTLPMYVCLAPEDRKQLQGYIQIFLTEKQFIGCNGLQVTPEMKLIIASVACLLMLNRREKFFPRLRSILVYPKPYWVDVTVAVGNGVVEQRREARLGESWSTDQVVLSWAQIQQDMTQWQDGRNVILHEFAHQLDQEDGKAEGVPVLPTNADYDQWAKVMTEHYQQLCQDLGRGIRSVLDPYGAKDPAEFFAVATETFFEKPGLLQEKHPGLYQQLQNYYRLDPVQWSKTPVFR